MKKIVMTFVFLILLGGCTYSTDGRLTANRNFWFANDAMTDITIVNNTTCGLYVFDSRNRGNRYIVASKGSTLISYRVSAYRSGLRNRREVTIIAEVYAGEVLVATEVKKFRLNNRPGKKDYILKIGGRKLESQC